MPLYLKGRFYANLVIKYLMECFYATDISVNRIVIYSQDDSHKGKILRQLVNLCYNTGFSLWSRDSSYYIVYSYSVYHRILHYIRTTITQILCTLHNNIAMFLLVTDVLATSFLPHTVLYIPASLCSVIYVDG